MLKKQGENRSFWKGISNIIRLAGDRAKTLKEKGGRSMRRSPGVNLKKYKKGFCWSEMEITNYPKRRV